MPDPTLLLNLGCGKRLHDAWQNLDFAFGHEKVILHDLRDPLPYPANSVDACYCSHVLGHLTPQCAKTFLSEIYRVLKPSGIFRVVVPDLQQIINNYQNLIGPLIAGDRSREADYDWTLIELYDQVTRPQSGGRMAEYLAQKDLPNPDFILSRIGEEGATLIEKGLHNGPGRPSLSTILSHPKMRQMYIAKARRKLSEYAVKLIAGEGARKAYQRGLFSHYSGELQWQVFDEFSLTRLLQEAGFQNIQKHSAQSSSIPGFANYHFDADSQGTIRKPESLYLEASRS